MEIKEIQKKTQEICDNMEKVIVGKRDVIEYVLAAFLAGGHVLLEDVPGTGKTMLAKSLAASFGMKFKRVQFTPDLLPSDVTGIYYFNQKTGEFEFRPGGVFSNILLADEINRATPRTQSSLLECMEEKQVTVDGETMPAGNPFFVIATQNPVETSGTFPLPEAELDRFMMKLSMGYPDEASEREILSRFTENGEVLDTLTAVCGSEEFLDMQKSCEKVTVHELILQYVLDIARRSREERNIAMGVSPRGAIALVKTARCYAAIRGKNFVTPEMIKRLAPAVFAHRLILADSFGSRKLPQEYIEDILGEIKAPTEDAFGS
ncbi:MAG: MoxR family ATPase [Roseburia sp.]|nr:MoxR family ATPase [Roseburia sp.]